MKNSALIVLGAIAVLGTTVSASTPSCINVTFPGFFNIGSCVSAIGNTCTGNQAQITRTITQFINCSINGISNLTLGSQLNLLTGLLSYLAGRIPIIGPIISGVLNLCTGSNPLPGCGLLQLGNGTICQDPIVLTFPSALGVGQCVTNATSVCQNGQPVTVS
ncbi:unnamed protein product, partial [Ixodes hexagonus]